MTILRSSSCNHTSAEHIALPPGCVGGHSNVLTTRAACDKAVTIAASVNVGANTTGKGLSVGKGASVLAYPPQAPSRNDRGGGVGAGSHAGSASHAQIPYIYIYMYRYMHTSMSMYMHIAYSCAWTCTWTSCTCTVRTICACAYAYVHAYVRKYNVSECTTNYPRVAAMPAHSTEAQSKP